MKRLVCCIIESVMLGDIHRRSVQIRCQAAQRAEAAPVAVGPGTPATDYLECSVDDRDVEVGAEAPDWLTLAEPGSEAVQCRGQIDPFHLQQVLTCQFAIVVHPPHDGSSIDLQTESLAGDRIDSNVEGFAESDDPWIELYSADRENN